MQPRSNFWQTLIAGTLALLASAPVCADAPTVAALDLCADQYVLAFTDRDRIVAVSRDAAGPQSFFGERAKGLKVIRGSAEEILMLRPDVLIRSWRGSPAMDAMVARVGVKTYQPVYAFTYEASLKNFEAIAAHLGEAEKGEAMAADYRARYKALQSAPHIPLKAVYVTPSGFTAGTDTFVDNIIRLAGLDPIAEDVGVIGWGTLPLERLVLNPPEVVIGSFFEKGSVHVSHWSSGRHGVFRGMVRDLPSIILPSKFVSCNGAYSVDAAEFIRAEVVRLGLMPTAPADLKENTREAE